MTLKSDRNAFALGVIEGFYGRSWSWASRTLYANFLKENGFGFYLYAPKSDTFLRKQWRETWPDRELEKLSRLGSVYQEQGLDWGIGLSPDEIYLKYDDVAKSALADKVGAINRLAPDILCVLLDDMKGDVPRLAETQAEVFNQIADLSTARRLILCPTYYTTDPILEKIFGTMPVGYWEDLGKRIDASVDFFWTGPEVCSTEYPESHLQEVTNRLGRKPFIWDNYPVNDSESRSKRLYLRSYENRPHRLSELSTGHAVNPMNQAFLSQIPFWTLAESYRTKTAYDPTRALDGALVSLCGNKLARQIHDDISLFQDKGLDGLDEAQKNGLFERYSGFDSPFAREIVDWLRGEYTFDPACLTE